MTYEARSKFVITSLRPSFAKIYPSTRPDLAVETFFHARPGSPLLRGIIDDDFITWFDKTELASLRTSVNIDNICECGRICSRDYEFRKDYEREHNLESSNITITNTELPLTTTNPVEEQTGSRSTETTTNNVTSNQTESSKNEVDISLKNASVIIQSTSESAEYFTEPTTNQQNLRNDSIIIPTAVYSTKQDINNDIQLLETKTNGELIVQKYTHSKNYSKDLDNKKPLARRKGTLKATYGNKHDSFFAKEKYAEPVVSSANRTYFQKEIKIIPKLLSASEKNNITTLQNNETSQNLSITSNSTIKKNISLSPKNVNLVTTPLPEYFEKEAKSMTPHTIATITKSNIKAIYYRTKKPKPQTQIKKPDLLPLKASYTNSIENNLNNTKNDSIEILTKKHVAKILKSINKEIHKIPPTPISETSKSLTEHNIKSDIAPENKGNFEILDKNSIWEMLKEDPDPNYETDEKINNNKFENVTNMTHKNERIL